MYDYLLFALVGLGAGSIFAAVALGVVITHRGTGVINFATGTMAMWGAYVVDELRQAGDLVLPVFFVPHRVHVGAVAIVPAIAVGVASTALLGLLAHLLVFRPLRNAPNLAKVVASVGVMLVLQGMVVLRFQSTPRAVAPILPSETVSFLGSIAFPRDRLWLAAVTALVAVLVWAWFRFTSMGLATRAAADDEQSVAFAGHSPSLLAGLTWVLSGAVTGLLVILATPMIVLTPLTYTLVIVPALAAALVGRLSSVGVAVAAGLALGSVQSMIQLATTKEWWPDWAAKGFTDLVPLAVIVVTLFVAGKTLPTRGTAAPDELPRVPRPTPGAPRMLRTVAAIGVGVALLVALDGSYRFGLVTSMILAVVFLSFVVLTGLVGQISLAQAAIAGIGGFTLSKLGDGAGIPFPVAPVLAASIAAAIGVVVGIPALRIRGAQLAVVTLAAAVTLERLVFRNPALVGTDGSLIPDATLFGLDLSSRKGTNIARLPFGFLVLAVLVGASLVVSNLIRSATGRRFLAVRSNERSAAAVGIDVASNKLLAFATASFLAGLGGALIGYSHGQLSAESFSTLVGLSFLAMAYLGGITSVAGALVAGILGPLGIGFVVLDRQLELGDRYLLLSGVALVLTSIFNPEGIVGQMRATFATRTRPPESAAVMVHSGAAPPRVPRPNAQVALNAADITVYYGGVCAVDALSLTVRQGEVVGLIGPNGAGKTSFIDAVTGFTAHLGTVHLDGVAVHELAAHRRARAGLRRTWQSIELFGDLTVRENVAVASDRPSVRSVTRDLVRGDAGGPNVVVVEELLVRMGLLTVADEFPSSLPLGVQKLVGVARACAGDPAVVLLDEPAAGLDTDESRELGVRLRELAASGVGLLLVDHDMGLVLETCDRVYVVDFGRLIAEGTPEEIIREPNVVAAYLGSAAAV